jgi:hypothetical protein
MNTAVRRGAIVVFLVCSVACSNSGPTSPSRISPSPPLSGPSRTFILSDSELGYPVGDFTQHPYFVLYDNGAFALHYPRGHFGVGTVPGQYRETNGVILFMFHGFTVDEVDATGTLRGDSLAVEYTDTMKQSDFQNAVYVLMR